MYVSVHNAFIKKKFLRPLFFTSPRVVSKVYPVLLKYQTHTHFLERDEEIFFLS